MDRFSKMAKRIKQLEKECANAHRKAFRSTHDDSPLREITASFKEHGGKDDDSEKIGINPDRIEALI